MNQQAFFALAARLTDGLTGAEVLFAGLDVEDSTFVRLNQNRVRQAGSVFAAGLGLTLIDGSRQVEGDCRLSGEPAADLALAQRLLAELRERIAHVPEDPYLNFSTVPATSSRVLPADLPDPAQAIGTLTGLAEGLDLVGIYTSGRLALGLASSLGHRHWHEGQSFHLDWTCTLDGDRALKDGLGGMTWDTDALAARITAQRERLSVLARPERRIEPGPYRAYLAPAAMQELLHLTGWGGFGLRDHRTQQSPLRALAAGEVTLHPAVSLSEEHGRALVPGFTGEGFTKPATVPLITGGRFADCLVDARSAREYGAAVNADEEAPESLAMAGGDLATADVLARLGTGLYISNLWYGNWSDRNSARVTGMTRFGTFWVEAGELVAPLAVMRFDDSLYHLLGDRLEGLTQERELLLSAETYGGRSDASALLPGVLVGEIALAL